MKGIPLLAFLLANLILYIPPPSKAPFISFHQTARLGQVTHAHTVRQCPSTLRFAHFLLLHTFLQGFGWSRTTKGETLHEACRGSQQPRNRAGCWLRLRCQFGWITKTQQMEFKASAPVVCFLNGF